LQRKNSKTVLNKKRESNDSLFFYDFFVNLKLIRIFVLSDWGNDLDTTIRKKDKEIFGEPRKTPYLC
jgi:hypothetical protein